MAALARPLYFLRVYRRPTHGELSHRPVPRSFWREQLAARTGGLPVSDYLIDEANLRGFRGAFRAQTADRPVDSRLSLEDIVVGLLAPQAYVDGRVFKLVLRILQSDQLDLRKLMFRSRREGADGVLYWLLDRVPPVEANHRIEELRSLFARAPRGYRPLDFAYDATRLIRRPARRDSWRRPPR